MATAARPRRATIVQKEILFTWEGKDKSGKIVRGEMRAATDNVVQAALRRQGISVLKIKKRSFARGSKVKQRDIAIFTRQLATMMRAGVPLLQSFDIAIKGSGNPAMARLMNEIRNDVETGTSLSQALRKRPAYFDTLYANLVQAGEQSGALENLLDRLATYQEKIMAIKSKIKAAMFYPAAVVVVAGAVVTVMMLFVIPQFKQVFTSFGADLPAPTLFVMAISDFF
ncbi:MAG: type 4 pilus biosis protein, partial [Rhodocyclales bacterium]|nr:type 4 pilus biosis protein [Rhodocyclales bacterium]